MKACSHCGLEKSEEEFYFHSTQQRRVPWCRDCFLALSALIRRGLREKAVAALGGKCVGCGIDDARVLCFDHIDGLRGKKRESADRVHRQVLAGSEAYQLLCHNCNHLKRFANGEFAARDLRERVR